MLANGTYASDFKVCSLSRFDDVLFDCKIAIKDEAKVADGSRKFNIGIAEKDCLWVWQGRVDRG